MQSYEAPGRDDEQSRIRPLLRSEYQRLVELGAFADEKVELLRGAIVRMSLQGYLDLFAVTQLNNLLTPALQGRALVLVQSPIIAGRTSQPEPDLAVIPLDGMVSGLPASAHLVVEVADSSLASDRADKLP